jgi:hypothetical protein
MKNKRWILVAIAVLVTVSLACNASRETPTPDVQPTVEVPPTAEVAPTVEVEPTVEVQPTSPPKDTSPPASQGAVLEILNDSGVDVWYVYLSPSQADQWGDDWLEDHVILNGDMYVLAGVPEGTYDVKAADENGEVIEVVWSVDLGGEMTWTITEDPIAYLYVSLSESTTWGDDWLGADMVDAGGSYVVDGIPRGTYDVKAADLDGESVEVLYNVDLAGLSTWTVVGKTSLPDNAVLRFEEHFDDNRNDWGNDFEDEDTFFMRPAGGQYCILIKSSQYTAWEWYEPFRPDEFVAEVACTVDGAADASCGLGFGPDGDNLYWFEVSPYDQAFALFLLENDEWQESLIEWTVSRNIDPDGVNFLSLERVGGVVSVFVNGVLVGQVDSDLFPTGRIGLGGSTYDQGNVTVCLDDLRVWRLE